MIVIMIIEWYQAETRTDWAVMIPNDSDNDTKVIPGQDPDWLSSDDPKW